MATGDINKELSRQFSYRIQDPVATGSEEGVRTSSTARLLYLLRAHRKLIRLIRILSPTQQVKIFRDYFKTALVDTDDSGVLSASDYLEPKQIFVKYDTGSEDWIEAEEVAVEDWQTVSTGQSAFCTPNLEQEKIYWTLIDNEIRIVPEVQYSLNISYLMTPPSYISLSANDLLITVDHYDLLLNTACSEFYLDAGDINLSTAYKNQVIEDIKLLAEEKQAKERKDEKN